MLINGKSVKWSAPLVFVLLICNIVYAEEPQVTESSLITLEECVRYALTNNPKLKEAAGNVDFNRAMVGVSKSAYLPQASTTGGYKHNDSSKTTFASTVQGTSAGSISALSKRSNTVSENTGVEQLIWDFGKTLNQIKLADENLTTAQYAFLETQEETIFNVKKAYFDALKAQLLADAAKENLEQSKVHLERAEGFYEVGFKQRFEVTKAEVAVSNAK